MSLTEVITTGIAAASLLLSGYVLLRQRRDAGRAHFTAEWESHAWIAYTNQGPGAARDVTVGLEARNVEGLADVEYLAPIQTMRLRVTRELYEHPPATLDLARSEHPRGNGRSFLRRHWPASGLAGIPCHGGRWR